LNGYSVALFSSYSLREEVSSSAPSSFPRTRRLTVIFALSPSFAAALSATASASAQALVVSASPQDILTAVPDEEVNNILRTKPVAIYSIQNRQNLAREQRKLGRCEEVILIGNYITFTPNYLPSVMAAS
jgi:hypothetical protein